MTTNKHPSDAEREAIRKRALAVFMAAPTAGSIPDSNDDGPPKGFEQMTAEQSLAALREARREWFDDKQPDAHKPRA